MARCSPGDPRRWPRPTQALNAPLGRLLAIAEAYPELKSSENFQALQDELTGTENRIAVARTDYNGAVNDFNALHPAVPVQHHRQDLRPLDAAGVLRGGGGERGAHRR